jgi:hypothetical protein
MHLGVLFGPAGSPLSAVPVAAEPISNVLFFFPHLLQICLLSQSSTSRIGIKESDPLQDEHRQAQSR